jgi:hypothetical protein
MKLLITSALFASLLSGFASACPPSQTDDHCDPKKHGEMAGPAQKLHDALKLSPEQDAAWKAMQDHARARMEHHQQERIEAKAEFDAFYDKLSPEQKKMLDAHHARHDGMHEGCDPKRLPPIKK